MMSGKKSIIEAIKMDLFRVITAAGDITKEMPLGSIREFMEHADKDFDRIKLNSRERKIKEEINLLANSMGDLSDPHTRLRWTEKVMTARCRL